MPFVPDKPTQGRFVPDDPTSPAEKPSIGSRLLSPIVGSLEAGLSLGTGSLGGLGGGLNYLATLAATGGDADAAKAVQESTQNALTYQPRTDAGQKITGAVGSVLSLPGKFADKVGDKQFDQLNGGPLSFAAPAAAAFMKTGLNAIPMLVGMKAGAKAAPGATPKVNLYDKPPGLMALLKKDVPTIVGNNLRATAGPQQARARLADALTNAPEYVKGSKPTAAEAVSSIAEGTPIQSLQQKISQTVTKEPVGDTGMGVSQAFNRRFMEQAGARDALKSQRNKLTATLREAAIKDARESNSLARSTNDKIAGLTDAVQQRFMSKAEALRDKGRFDTTVGEQTRRSLFKDENMGPVAEKLGLQRPALSTPGMSTGATPRPPARYTPQAARAEEAAIASSEMVPLIELRQKQLAGTQSKLSQLEAKDIPVTDSGSLLQTLDSLAGQPAVQGSTVASKAMSGMREKIISLTDKHGIIDPDAAYSIRKEIGHYIDEAVGADQRGSGRWDKSMTASLEKNIQKAFDESMDKATGGKWSPYLNTFSRLSQKLDSDVLRSERMYTPAQSSVTTNTHGVAESAGIHPPPLLSRTASGFNWLLENRRKALEGPIAARQAELLLNPKALAAELQKGMTPEEIARAAQVAALKTVKRKAVTGGLAASAAGSKENK